MTGAQTSALVVAVVAPLVVVVGPGGRQIDSRSRMPLFRWVQAVLVVAAGAWLTLVVSGAGGRAGAFHVTSLAAAAGCGSALVAIAAVDGTARRRSLSTTGAVLAAVGVSLTAGSEGPAAVGVVGGLALAALLIIGLGSGPAATARPTTVIPALLAVAGVVASGVGFAVVHSRSGQWTLSAGHPLPLGAIAAFLVAAALLAACGTLGLEPALRSGTEPALRSGTEPALRSGTEPGALLLAGGLAVGLSAAPLRAGAGELGAAVVILAAAAVVAAGVRRGALSLALLALAAASGPAALAPGSRLLAAAAVVVAAVDLPWAWLTAVPGAISLVAGVVDDGGRLAVATAVGAAAVALLLAHAASEEGAFRRRPSLGALPAAGIGAWLIVAPGTWTWAAASLGAYDEGMARAAAAGLMVVGAYVGVGALRRRPNTSPARRAHRGRRGRGALGRGRPSW
ncbi:MAG: hypothetical protein M3256_14645 [Actinomycetota bacterium]|nr:hypothetical protein [Actinomycetota bacterium]